jgi:protein-S-isoprenylcysteine O-methyltransferase Ste14
MRWAGAVLGTATLPISWWVFESIGKNVIPTEHHELVTAGFAATAKINFER